MPLFFHALTVRNEQFLLPPSACGLKSIQVTFNSHCFKSIVLKSALNQPDPWYLGAQEC